MQKQNELKVRANYNGQEYTVKLVGDSAEKVNDILLAEIRGKPFDAVTDVLQESRM